MGGGGGIWGDSPKPYIYVEVEVRSFGRASTCLMSTALGWLAWNGISNAAHVTIPES
jgi:hypothetical protein